MSQKNTIIFSMMVFPLLSACSVDMSALHAIEHKAALMNRYEIVSLKLAKENRELGAQIKRLEFEIVKLKQDKFYFEAKNKTGHEPAVVTHGEAHGDLHGNEHAERSIASVHPVESPVHKSSKDFVEFKTYKWHADDMQKIADKEFKEKHFEKAAQFYSGLAESYPHYKGLSDEFYFKAGISAFESGEHHDWTIHHFESLMTKFPTSQYFRSAKLWIALTHMKMGEKKKFFATVEEFRKKYRNTAEWKILSSYYEKIEEKTNE
jgi:TolA-binding protein